MKHKNIYDVIIVGGGPAGCSAAIVLARSMRKVMIIDEGKQRNLSSRGMHVYLTRDGISPTDYIELAHKELANYNIEYLSARAKKARMLADKGFEITDSHNGKHLCRRILLATGVTDHIPDIPGMHELWGCCIYHCPFCDGWECRDRAIALYAQKENGYGMALALRELSTDLILFTDGAKYLRPKQRLQLQALNIDVISKPVKELIREDKQLTHIALQDGTRIAREVLFVNHGHHVNGELLAQLHCKCTKKGAAITSRKQETNIEGVYVAGDASIDMHFVVVAAAEGVKAAVAIHNDLLNTDNLKYK